MADKNDPVDRLIAANQKHNALKASLSKLRSAAAAASAKRTGTEAAFREARGDHAIGRVTDAVFAKAKAAHEAAQLDEDKAEATLRAAEEDIKLLDEAIPRLTTEVHATRIAHYAEKQIALAIQLRDKLQACVAINKELNANYEKAANEFPEHYEGRRTKPRPWPVAAGLRNLAWHELLDDPNAIDGGRLGHWLRMVAEFLNPPEAKEPRPRRDTSKHAYDPAPSAPRRDGGRWAALPEGQ